MRRFMKKAVAGCLVAALVTGPLSVPGGTINVYAAESTDAVAEELDSEAENELVDIESKDSEKKLEDADHEDKKDESDEKDSVDRENIEKTEQAGKESDTGDKSDQEKKETVKSEDKKESSASKNQTLGEADASKNQTSGEEDASKNQTSDEENASKNQTSNAVDAAKPSDEEQTSQKNSDIETSKNASASEIQKEENAGEEAGPEETKKVLTIHLTKDVFKKTYGSKDPETIYIGQNYDIVGETLEFKPYLRVNSYIRVDGEEPGRYAITSISFNTKYGFDEIKLDEEPIFTIEKKRFTSTCDRKREIADNGKEQCIDLFKLYHWEDKEKPERFKLAEFSDEDKEKFKTLPTVDETGNLRFTLKQLGNGATVNIKILAENKYYSYPDIHLLFTVRVAELKAPAERTEDEIRKFYNAHTFSTSYREAWTVTPNARKNIAGELKSGSITNGLNALNFVRYVAGFDADVTINEEYAKKAQAGTTLLQAVGKLQHTPAKPNGVSDEFYKLGYAGTSASNIGMGYTNLGDAVINGWMEDGDAGNISRVGHRRWCLNPTMKQTGFGHSGSFTAMYSFDRKNEEGKDISYVTWPAKMMPIDYFNGPWSVSINSSVLRVPDQKALKVTMTKKNGQSVVLDNNCTNKSGKYLHYDGGNYGLGPAIIFKSNVGYSASDEVTVKIEGIQDKYGNDVPLEYTVHFFKMNKSSSSSSSGSGSSGSSGGGSRPSGSSGGSGGGSRPSGSSGGSGGVGASGVRPSGGGSGAGSGVTGATGGSIGLPSGNASIPSYVVKGNWMQQGDKWQFRDAAGKEYKNTWAAVENPYANLAAGASPFDWFRFDENGNMMTGWVVDSDGSIYFLNPFSDGTRGKMQTGWVWIPDGKGGQQCFYFNPESDGHRGCLLRNTVIDGSTVNAYGAWTVNGQVQTKSN